MKYCQPRLPTDRRRFSLESTASRDVLFSSVLFAVHLLVAVTLFGIFAGATLAQPPFSRWVDFVRLGLAYGIGVGQVITLCGWTALGTGSYFRRMLIAVAMITLTYYANWLTRWMLPTRGSQDFGTISGVCMATILFFVLMQVPYWTLRRFKGWRIEHGSQTLRDLNASAGATFGIVDILAWMAYVAVPLAIISQVLLSVRGLAISPRELFPYAFLYFLVLISTFSQALILLSLIRDTPRFPSRREWVVLLSLSLILPAGLLGAQLYFEGRLSNWRAVFTYLVWNWSPQLSYLSIGLALPLPMAFSLWLAARQGYRLRTAASAAGQSPSVRAPVPGG